MQVTRRLAVLFALCACASFAGAQRPGTIEAGVFGHFTKLDKDVGLGNNSVGAGARLGFFPLRWLAIEAEYSFGTLSSNARGADLWLPFRGLVVLNAPIADRIKLLIGAGYKQDVWKGDSTANQYEDGFTALGGLRVCLKNNWSLRPEVVFDHNPSPNFQTPVTSTSTHIGFRFGVSKFFGRGRETCARGSSSPAAPAPTPVRAPPIVPSPVPTPPPAARPTATISANPTSITSGGSAMLIWSSTNATTCSAPWTQSTGSNGSQSVRPTSTTTYTTTCTGAGGTVTAQTTVNVTQPAPPPAAAAPPPAAAPPRAPPREMFRLEGVYFDFDKSTIKPAGRVKLDSAVTILNRYSDMRIEIQGHTDSKGTDEYNMRLSDRRANAVRDYLVSKGISASRLTTRGFGESQPAATNDTDEGRAQNRRVMLIEVNR